MAEPTDVVIAGTRPFALALFAPVTERAGTRPRIAPEPAMVLTLCAESSGVLVVEYDPRWLPALTLLRQKQPGLRVVAALPRGQEGAALSLGPLQIDAVPWDGQALSVLPAIERAIGGSSARAATSPVVAAVQTLVSQPLSPAAAPPTRAVPSPEPAGPASPQPDVTPTLDLFHDLGGTAATPIPATLEAVPTVYSPARAGVAAWPATGPGAAEAELLLRGAVAGAVELSPLRAVTEQTIAGLSPLEREVFTGGTLAVDAELIRHAAVLRLRVAAALASRPPPGTAIDGAAVAELLSEIDGVLGAVKELLADAPPEAKVSLEAIRNALVKEAVDFSEACHEVGSVELPTTPAPLRGSGRAPGHAAAARVLSVHAGAAAEDRPEERRRRVVPVIILVIVLALGAGYHAWNYYVAPPRQPAATYEGAPAGTMALQSGKVYFLKALPGHTVSAADMDAYRQREARRGNQVREVGPGTWIIEPAQTGGGAAP
jgi:hypothetical protein